MTLLAFLPSGGIAYPGFSALTGKSLKIYDPKTDSLLYDIGDDDFRNGFTINGEVVYFAVENIVGGYNAGQTMNLTAVERWEFPVLAPGSRIEFRATVTETYTATSQPSWVQNAKGLGQSFLFSGKIQSISQSADESGTQVVTYDCRSWIEFAKYVNIQTDVDAFRLPERSYNVPVTADSVAYKKCIKKSTMFVTGLSQYNYAPFGYVGIQGPTGTHAELGLAQNTTGNLTMTTGEIIKDLFGSHRKQLARERVTPKTWDGYAGTGTLPYVQAELDDLTIIPDQIIMPATFVDAIKTLLRKTYPNYSLWIDRDAVWHFTPVLDNLRSDVTDPNLILSPSSWEDTRLGVIRIKMAEVEADGNVYGRLIRGSISDTTAGRYTAVRIVGQEKVTTQQASTLRETLEAAWGNGNAAQQVNLESGYVHGGMEASMMRHIDRGDSDTGIPIYKVGLVSEHAFITIKGFQSELWPHTNDEWNGATLLLANTLAEVESMDYSWVADALQFTILDSSNIADVGDGTPGYQLKVEHGGLIPSTLQTEDSESISTFSRIQLTDDFGYATTVGPNQLSVAFRSYQIVESGGFVGSIINGNPTTPCDARAIVPLGRGRANVGNSAIPGDGRPSNLLEFGQSLGQTYQSALGRLTSKAEGGSFFFGGKLIIPFAAIARAREKKIADANQKAFESACASENARAAQDVKIIYEKSTNQYFEARVPPGEQFGGNAALIAGVRRELVIKAPNFTREELSGQYSQLAKMVFRTVADLEPAGEGWAFVDSPRYLSLIDLHFRLRVDAFLSAPAGAVEALGLQEAVVTQIDVNFRSNETTLSLSTQYNPLGQYSFETLRDVMISAKQLREFAEQQAKEKRLADCRKAVLPDTPINALPAAAVCRDQVVRSAGPGGGKPGAPGPCHPSDGIVESGDGIGSAVSTNADYSGGYSAGDFDTTFNLAGGFGWQVLPFIDTLGRMFLQDRFGGMQRGDESQLTEGESVHTGVVVTSSFAGYPTQPTRLTKEMGETALHLLATIAGITPETPSATNYNVVASYDSDLGTITLVHDNMVVNEFTHGRVVLTSPTANEMPYLLIASNTAGVITLKDPVSPAFPAESEIPVNTHIYVMAQRKPLHDSTLVEGTRLFKDSGKAWKAVEPDGDTFAVTITGATDFIPNAAKDGDGDQPVYAGILGRLLNNAGETLKVDVNIGTIVDATDTNHLIFKAQAALTISKVSVTNRKVTSSDGSNFIQIQVINKTTSNNLKATAYHTNDDADFAAFTALDLGLDQNLGMAANAVLDIFFDYTLNPGELEDAIVTVEYTID